MWRTIAATDVRLTPAEKAALEGIQNSNVICGTILTDVIGEFRGAVAAVGGGVDEDEEKVPDLLRIHVINRTRWLWLCEFPTLKAFQTEHRKELNASAEKMLNDILAGEVKVTSPTESESPAGGNWNSQNKILPRTHPIPSPGTQYSDGTTGYANPGGPGDAS